jgi:hypothetical protein
MKQSKFFGMGLVPVILFSLSLAGCPGPGSPNNDGDDTTPGATIAAGIIEGTVGTALSSPAALKIVLTNDAKFKAIAADTDLSSWVTAKPAGIAVKAAAAVAVDGTELSLKFEGTPAAANSGFFAVTIPAASLNHAGAAAITVTENKLAQWYIDTPNTDTAYDLRFGVISDTHVGATNGGTVAYPAYPNDQRLNKVLDWYNTQDHLKTLAIVGDLVDLGSVESHWDQLKASFAGHLGSLRLLAVLGNHEGYSVANTAAAIRFENAAGQPTNLHHVINGYHFIMLSPGKAGTFDEANLRTPGHNGVSNDEGAPFYAAIKDWANAQIAAAADATPDKPVFVFLHHPIKNTTLRSYDSTSTFGEGINAEWNVYPNVVVFAGHEHTPNNDPRSIWQGGFTAVNTASTHTQSLGSLGDSAGGIAWGNAAAQGMIVKVKGSVVTIENYDFDVSTGPTPLTNVVQLLDQTWKFDVSSAPAAPGLSFPYTTAKRNTQKQAPVFGSGTATVKATTANSVTVEFDQAAIPVPNPGLEAVHSYRFDFYTGGGGTPVKSVKQWSDFMLTPRLRKSKLEQLIDGLTPGTTYELRIYAYSSFQAVSTQYLTVNFTTDGS